MVPKDGRVTQPRVSLLCQTDPFWTASSLSAADHREARNQSICSLAELLELAKGNATLLLNLRDLPREHPYRGRFLNITLEALLSSGFPQHQVSPARATPLDTWEPRPLVATPPSRPQLSCLENGGPGDSLSFTSPGGSSWGQERQERALWNVQRMWFSGDVAQQPSPGLACRSSATQRTGTVLGSKNTVITALKRNA